MMSLCGGMRASRPTDMIYGTPYNKDGGRTMCAPDGLYKLKGSYIECRTLRFLSGADATRSTEIILYYLFFFHSNKNAPSLAGRRI